VDGVQSLSPYVIYPDLCELLPSWGIQCWYGGDRTHLCGFIFSLKTRFCLQAVFHLPNLILSSVNVTTSTMQSISPMSMARSSCSILSLPYLIIDSSTASKLVYNQRTMTLQRNYGGRFMSYYDRQCKQQSICTFPCHLVLSPVYRLHTAANRPVVLGLSVEC
jgi:hypothetical protein